MKRFLAVLGILTLALGLAGTDLAAAGTPAASPVPGGQRTIPLAQGDRLLAVSPDGERLAILNGQRDLCVAAIADGTVPICAGLGKHGVTSLDQQQVAWSPDSTRVAFTENSTQLLRDSDIWVMDAASGALADLTDDGYDGRLPIAGPVPGTANLPVDVAPAWSADGQTIFFARSVVQGDRVQGTSIERIPAAGGTPQRVIAVTGQEPFVIYWGGIRPAADGRTIFFTLSHADITNPANGVYAVNVDGSNLRHIAGATDPTLGYPILIGVAANGGWGLVTYAGAATAATSDLRLGLINLKTAAIQPIAAKPAGARGTAAAFVGAFSPDGSRLAYGWAVNGKTADQRLLIRDLASGATRQIMAGGFAGVPVSQLDPGLTWATNGTLVAATATDAIVLVHLEGR